MRRPVLLLSLLVMLAGVVVPANADTVAVRKDLGAAAIISSNVEYVATIPIEAIGGRMLTVNGQKRFYVTGAPGLVIYDVTNPALPRPLGALPLPHFQNEDVDVSDDGSRVIISTDTANAGSDGRAGGGSIRVIDTSNVAAPAIAGYIASSNHTTTCADPKCEWLYGSSGKIYDARTPGAIVDTGKRWGRGGHALNRDATGLLISDSNPRLVLDVTGEFASGASYATPIPIADGKPKGTDGLLQHNNVRVGAEQWVPRDPEAPDYTDPALRPGELLLGNSESNVRPQCSATAGGLSTWSMVNFDQGENLQQLDVFRPLNGNWLSKGDPAVNALGCSGHWFTERAGVVAAGWYEHGLKFFKVDQTDGKITQIGFFNPVATEAGSAHWVTDSNGVEYVYTTDYARGIDIVRFKRDAPVPTQAELDASWLATLHKVNTGAFSNAERYACRLGALSASS